MLRTRRDVLHYLAQATDYERQTKTAARRTVFDLDRMRRLCSALGDPQLAPHTVHLTGTKGKGSTAILLHDLLRAHGARVGLYTSPHFERLEERIVVDGRPISSRGLAAALEEVRRAAVRCRRREPGFAPTFFDLFTAAAFVHFRRRRVAFAVIEVGLGGRLDSTNVLSPSVCAITTIDYDHTHVLGDTLSKIAREKCGILRPCVPCISAESKPEPLAVIEAAVSANGGLLRRLGRDFHVANVRVAGPPSRMHQRFDLVTTDHDFLALRLPVAGEHQVRNAAVAVACLEALQSQGRVRVSGRAVRSALGSLRLPGRVEILRRRPWIVCDAAHNPAGIRALVRSLRVLRGPARTAPTTFLFGCASDKDWPAMLGELRGAGARLVVTAIPSPRSVPPERLRTAALRSGWRESSLEICRDPLRRLTGLVKDLPVEGLLCITGSFYLAGRLRRALLRLSRPESA
ncbi:MAG: bifunctional folylpolyglutamate synthase/dihydrofolate synthase [Planctomycetes bacterium]|nr:bifunctional folylpolyglutamate synthase/dihydrofolate synthase [Planctomycetota bacterium]